MSGCAGLEHETSEGPHLRVHEYYERAFRILLMNVTPD